MARLSGITGQFRNRCVDMCGRSWNSWKEKSSDLLRGTTANVIMRPWVMLHQMTCTLAENRRSWPSWSNTTNVEKSRTQEAVSKDFLMNLPVVTTSTSGWGLSRKLSSNCFCESVESCGGRCSAMLFWFIFSHCSVFSAPKYWKSFQLALRNRPVWQCNLKYQKRRP